MADDGGIRIRDFIINVSDSSTQVECVLIFV